MKLKLKILAMALMISSLAIAQRPNHPGKDMSPEQMAQKRAETLKAKLTLTDAQYNQVYDQLLSNAKLIRAQREAMKKMRDDNDAKMKSILTPEQYAELKKMQDQRRERMGKNRNNDDDPNEMETPPGNK